MVLFIWLCLLCVLGYYESADGEFVKSDLASFVSANKLPLVSVFTRESAPEIFESAIKKQVCQMFS